MTEVRRRPSPLLIFGITLTGITGNTLVSPAIPDILAGVGADPAAAGLLVSAMTLPGIVLAPVIGILADRFGRRRVIVPCMVLFGVAGGLAALSTALWVLVALRVLQGIGSAGLINLAVVTIGDHWSGVDRSRMIGRNSGVLTAALAVLPLVGGTLADVGGWQAPFLIYPLAVVMAVVVARRLPDINTSPPTSVRHQLTDVARLLRRPPGLAVLGASFLTFALVFGMNLTTLPVHAEQVFGLPARWRGVLQGLPAVATFAASLNLGRLTAWLGRPVLVAVGAGVFAAGYLVIGVTGTVVLLGVGLLVVGLGEGMLIPPLQDAATAIGSDEQRGTVVASFVSSARTGQTVGPILAAGAFGMIGTQATFVAGAAVGGVLFLALAAARRLIPAD